MRAGSFSNWAVTKTISQPAASTRLSRSGPIERPQLAVTPRAIVFDCDLVLGKGQIGPSEAAVRVLDPVLRLRMQAIQHEPCPDPRLRSGLGSGISEFDGVAGAHDAFVRTSLEQRCA
jgi:hypothetical protein